MATPFPPLPSPSLANVLCHSQAPTFIWFCGMRERARIQVGWGEQRPLAYKQYDLNSFPSPSVLGKSLLLLTSSREGREGAL